MLRKAATFVPPAELAETAKVGTFKLGKSPDSRELRENPERLRNTSQPFCSDAGAALRMWLKCPAAQFGTNRAQVEGVTVRHPADQQLTSKVLMKILLAVDGSPCSDEAIEEIGRRPWPAGSEIKVLTTWELPLPPTPEAWAVPPDYFEELDRVASEHAGSIMEHAVERLKKGMGAATVIEGEVLPGPPRVVILDVAERWGADLIAVGSHGYRGWERFLMGSVSQSVVSHAKCSVEVVRCRKRAGDPKET